MNSETVVSLFPRLKKGWVGDVMPMNDGNKMKLFYLYDTDNNGAALMHPFYSFTTDNFYEFTNDGVTVKPTDDKKYQDYFGLGTGSYIRVGDTLHCFYTGVNTYIFRTTAIMHAVSTDNGKTRVSVPSSPGWRAWGSPPSTSAPFSSPPPTTATTPPTTAIRRSSGARKPENTG